MACSATPAHLSKLIGPSLLVQERVEDKRFFAALGCGGRGICTVGGVEHARLAGRFGLAIERRGSGGRRRGRRQIERTLAAAAAQRKRCRGKQNDGPPRAG